jgi:hypothetical protein
LEYAIKQIKPTMKKLVYLTVLCGMFLTSCMTTKTPVGEFLGQEGKTTTYDKGKQFWLFWGILPIGKTHVSTPGHGNCQVVTKFKVSDALISGLTGGLVTSYSIKVEVKEGRGDDPNPNSPEVPVPHKPSEKSDEIRADNE